MVTSVAELMETHVGLVVESLDRVYLNGYVPKLQVPGQVVSFMVDHVGARVPSPAIFNRVGTRFRKAVKSFAADHDIPLIVFGKGDRKIDVMRPFLAEAERGGRVGVVAIGAAQEFQNVFAAHRRESPTPSGLPQFSFFKADRRVTCYYFYVFDDDFGPCFIKICAYFPYPIKVWCNGHEWAKRQAAKAGVEFRALANGFADCDDPVRLQSICDQLSHRHISLLFERWIRIIPRPLTDHDRAAGFWWELSMRQVEMSRTVVFDQPRHARGFFEAVIRDNLGLGRPDEVELIFKGRARGPGRPPKPFTHKTRIITRGVDVSINIFYRHSRVKQYLKEGRALRIETVVNSPDDLGVQRRLHNLTELQTKARDINRRVLETEHAGQSCAIGPTLFERIQQPYIREGQRTGALRFGDQRAMALAGALCLTLLAVTGFTNRSLRAHVAGLLGPHYSANQMSYDLRRLRLHGLIRRLEGHNRYMLTKEGQRFAVFYSKLGERVLPPLFAIDRPNTPTELRRSLSVIDRCINSYLTDAGLAAA